MPPPLGLAVIFILQRWGGKAVVQPHLIFSTVIFNLRNKPKLLLIFLRPPIDIK